jgi:RNA polymerase sigma-70 factor, ECF subfamily
MSDDPRDDASIIQRILEGEVQLFGILVGRYERLMYSFLLPQVKSFQEVQDISQEAFLKAYRHLSSFDSSRRFSSWVLKIGRNILIDRYRKNSETLGTPSGSIQEIIDRKTSTNNEDEPERKIELQEEFKKTFVNMLQLPEELKIPLLLRVLQELSYEEIAEILDIPVQTVKNRIFRARKALREKRDSENAM